MFHIAYNKQTKYILYFRNDNSTINDLPEMQHYLDDYCNNNDLDVENYTAIELPWNPKAQYVIGRDKFDETDNSIYADPDWVAPTPAPTPAE